MSQSIIINHFDDLVVQACHNFIQEHSTAPTTLFLGPTYRKALRDIASPAFNQIPMDKIVTLQTYRGLTLYPIDTDILLVAIVASPES